MTGLGKKYLFQFAHENLEFRIPELKAVASLFGIPIHIPESHDENRPFLTLELPSEECARKIASRTVSVKSLFELWANDCTYEGIFKKLKQVPTSQIAPYVSEQTSFKFAVNSFSKIIQQKEKVDIIENFLEYGLMFNGQVNLTEPKHKFGIHLDYGLQANTLDEPRQIYFARWLMDGQRELITKYDVKKRKFIGNTSMEAGLSLLMANIGKTRPGTLVLDPFVGTGSLLVACAHFGSHVTGTEIDVKLLHGIGKASRSGQKWRSRDENIRNSLAQYGLEQMYLDVIAADSSRPIWRQSPPLFDAIITDPPYGIRESTRKIEDTTLPNSEEERPGRAQYHISQVFTDLLNLAARHLVVGGRLVYWYPIYKAEFSQANIPQHPCLTPVAQCEQSLNTKTSRLLLTVEKYRHAQNEREIDSAFIPIDPFEKASFRDKYFGSEVIAKEHITKQFKKVKNKTTEKDAAQTLKKDPS